MPISIPPGPMLSAVSGFLLATGVLAGTLSAQEKDSLEESAMKFALRMPAAIDSADYGRFIALFREDAVMFAPFRVEPGAGRSGIADMMRPIFSRLEQAPSRPVFSFRPRNVRVSLLGVEGAVVSWEMDVASGVARRTVVLARHGSSWLIVHVHADNAAVEEAQ